MKCVAQSYNAQLHCWADSCLPLERSINSCYILAATSAWILCLCVIPMQARSPSLSLPKKKTARHSQSARLLLLTTATSSFTTSCTTHSSSSSSILLCFGAGPRCWRASKVKRKRRFFFWHQHRGNASFERRKKREKEDTGHQYRCCFR